MEAGTTLKHYRILSRLGEGGMGVVYHAEDTRLGRAVALKVFPADLEMDEERLARFEREARAASAISHPGVATLYDFDRDGSTAFLTMEYVEGSTLRQLLQQGPLPLPRLLDCLSQVAEALAAAHRKGIIHRDLKPENVMAADSGFYKILDFGLARMELREDCDSSGEPSPTQVATVSRELTGEGKVLGTIAYMSPEQVQGWALDARSDIFSFGSLAYELATGVSPFRGNNAIATFHSIVHEDPGPMTSIRPDLPQDLERIVAKCLARDPMDRYQTAADLAVDLRALRRESESGSRGHYVSRPGLRVAGRARPRVRAAWVLAAAVIVAAGGVALWVAPRLVRRAEPVLQLPAASRGRVVVTFFSNRSGDPETDWLSQGLPEMLTTDLAGTAGLEVISTQRLYDLLAAAGRSTDGPLDRATATQLARWAGAGVVISGAIFRSGERYRIDAQAFDTADGQVLTASRVEGDDIFRMADRMAAELRDGLQVAAPKGRGLNELMTSSPEAFRDYSRGMKLSEQLRFREAADEFSAALGSDPAFALAQLRLGMCLLLDGRPDEGLPWITQAARRSETMPQRERLLAQMIQAFFVDRDDATGEARFRSLVEHYPQDVEDYFWCARARTGRGADDMAAIRTLRRALAIDPNNPLVVAGLIGHLKHLGLGKDAEAIRGDFLKRNPAMAPRGEAMSIAPWRGP